MSKYSIGDKVVATATTQMMYDNGHRIAYTKKIKPIELIVVGVVYRPTGIYHRATGSSYEDFEPAYLSNQKKIGLVQCRKTVSSKIIEVPFENVEKI